MVRIVLIYCIFICLACSQKSVSPEQIKTPIKYLALGDSYTIGESVAESGRWPVQLQDSLIARGEVFDELKIIATTGWRTDDLSSAMDEAKLENDYNLVSLLIGVNNQYQGRDVISYEPEFSELLDRAIMLAKGVKENVFVVSIPDYAFTPFGQTRDGLKITNELEAYNMSCKRITLEKGIKHVNITPISKNGIDQANLVAADGLHPSADQYTLWVQQILEEVF